MKISLIDIGSNLTHETFAQDRDAVMARALEAGVRRQIVTGADMASSHQAAALAAANPAQLSSTAGVHPHHARSFDASRREELTLLLRRPEVVAVGECGLDYFRNFSPPDAQRAAFVAQLEVAIGAGKPVFLHQRDAHADFAAILKDFRHAVAGGVAHCFTGGRPELEDYLALDLYIGVTGWVSDERRGQQLREAVPHIPADRLLVETDAPYLLPRDLVPRPHSRRNEPCYLPHIAAAVARLRGESLDDVAASTTRNAIRFFRLDGAPEAAAPARA
ncbi:MAG TPA: TatD family hydrolase [Steroidobacteraceae bacterium]|nr:TatD family hydrolase [Steroidobacteraceae bacterium]